MAFLYRAAKDAATAVADRVSAVVGGPRQGPSPAVRDFLAANGRFYVTSVTVVREPVESMVSRFVNIATFGALNKAMKRLSYDAVYHLYMIIGLSSDPATPDRSYARIERNQVVGMQNTGHPTNKAEVRVAAVPRDDGHPITFAEFIMRGALRLPGPAFWLYDARSNNCQDWVMAILDGNGINTPELTKFVKQSAEELISSGFGKIARGVTDLAATADVALHGRGQLRGRGAAGAPHPQAEAVLNMVRELIGHDTTTSEKEIDRAGAMMFGPRWSGPWARDDKPMVTKKQPYGVMNLGRRSGGGIHWVGVVFRGGGKAPLIYDSFARKLAAQKALGAESMSPGSRAWQKDRETDCGQRSLAAMGLYHLDKRAAAALNSRARTRA